MGAHICQFGYEHKICRCPETHRITCPIPEQYEPPQTLCLVMQMRLDGRRRMPKHLGKHEPHNWWHTPDGGGHQIDNEEYLDYRDRDAKKLHCPGWEAS